MSGRGGKDKSHKDYLSRSEENNKHGRNNPPSRHLWVGNLSRNLDERSLAHYFLRYGELESVAFQPGRSYAFINFNNEEDAFAAIEELQGYSVAGHPLKIEFTKAEKSTSQRDDYSLQHRDEDRSSARRPSFSQGDLRRHTSPDSAYPDKPKSNDKDHEPSEVLWIGFPAQLKVDEFILRKTFAPFGEIDRITAFPGRTYAFVRFKNLSAACRAKETLQGKLFNNPRVHLCFAKNESGNPYRARNSIDASTSPHSRPYGHISENPHYDRDFVNITGDPSIRSPHFTSNFEPDDPDIMSFGRKNTAWAGGNVGFEQRFPKMGSEQGVPLDAYEHHDRLSKNKSLHFREFSPPDLPQQGSFDDDTFDLPEDSLLFRGAKKLKTSSLPLENELAEYPFSDPGLAKHLPSRAYPDFQRDVYDNNIESYPSTHKLVPDHRSMRLIQTYEPRTDHFRTPYDSFPIGSVPSSSFPERKRLNPELHEASVSKEWKWEGTIAKGGTPVCRARCFPVGQVMDMILPEFLDCTARTSLDMLAKHYYRAAVAWVVFFVPASDADIAFYNEFMYYLGEKQRAAVAKLDDMSTLFLVPPSDFSEKVLKVPGKLSISGVVLRVEHPGSSYGSVHGNTSIIKPTSPPTQYSSMPTLPGFERIGVGNMSASLNLSSGFSPAASFPRPGNFSDSVVDTRHIDDRYHHDTVMVQNSSSNIRNIASQSNSMMNLNEGYNPVPVSRFGNQHLQDKPPTLSSKPVTAFQPEELVQLASTLLGQQRDSGAVSAGSDWAQQKYVPNYPNVSDTSSSQYGQMQQQISHVAALPQRERQPSSQVNQHPHIAEQEEGDTEKRLQATLQLAAALLQQIQQGKGN